MIENFIAQPVHFLSHLAVIKKLIVPHVLKKIVVGKEVMIKQAVVHKEFAKTSLKKGWEWTTESAFESIHEAVSAQLLPARISGIAPRKGRIITYKVTVAIELFVYFPIDFRIVLCCLPARYFFLFVVVVLRITASDRK